MSIHRGQPWIWAVGQNARSDDLNFPIFRHTDYGAYNMSFLSALAAGGVLFV